MKKHVFSIVVAASCICQALGQERIDIKLPPGFAAQVFADDVGRARHIAVTPQGHVYVKLGRVENGNGILMFEDTDKDGKADKQTGFGDYAGTGIALTRDYLYATSDSEVYRYALDNQGRVRNPDTPERIVRDLVDKRQHASKSITLDTQGNIYVNIGAPSNACQERDRMKGSPGMMPCPILDSAGGIWQFRASKPEQTYADGKRYATGLRNVVGLDWNKQLNQLF